MVRRERKHKAGAPLDGGLLELVGVDLEDAREDDVVRHEEGRDHEGGEDEDVEEVVAVVRLWSVGVYVCIHTYVVSKRADRQTQSRGRDRQAGRQT